MFTSVYLFVYFKISPSSSWFLDQGMKKYAAVLLHSMYYSFFPPFLFPLMGDYLPELENRTYKSVKEPMGISRGTSLVF
jgi:hypothetical protein